MCRRFGMQSIVRLELRKHKKSPPCSEHDGDRHLNHYEKALVCIISQAGAEMQGGIYA